MERSVDYKNVITLNKNARGCYILDTVKGCSYAKNNPYGCYGECYAANIANIYGMNFKNPVKRLFIKDKCQLYFSGFYDVKHETSIIDQIKNIDMPFIRIGEMGDPSEYWEHTIYICSKVYVAGKPIVIITKHWKTIPDNLLKYLSKYGIIINTSISALDSKNQIKHRLKQYNLLKNYCKSILRVVTCDFNLQDNLGIYLNGIQENLLKNDNIIDTIFRPSIGNDLVQEHTINVSRKQFLKSKALCSVKNKDTFFSYCSECKEMCGVNF